MRTPRSQEIQKRKFYYWGGPSHCVSCNLEKGKTNASPRPEPKTSHTKPSRSTKWAIWNDEDVRGKWWINSNFEFWLSVDVASNSKIRQCEPVDRGKDIITFWKALRSRYWNLEWKLDYLGSERRETNFSEGGAFLVNWAVAPPGWCHTQFLFKF